LDADLILLGLATHEPHFMILREKVIMRGRSRSTLINSGDEKKAADFQTTDEFQLLHLGHGARFRTGFALEDAIGSHPCSLEVNMRETNGIPLVSPLPLTVAIIHYVETLKAAARIHPTGFPSGWRCFKLYVRPGTYD
jgi:hypothetical protein